MRGDAAGAVPAIIAVLKRDPENWTAIQTLGAIGPDAREAIRTLVPLMARQGHTAYYAKEALVKIGPDRVASASVQNLCGAELGA
jgi:hypothetical protein